MRNPVPGNPDPDDPPELDRLRDELARFRRKLDRDRLHLDASRRLLARLGTATAARRLGHAAFRLPDFYIIGAPRCGTTWLKVALDRSAEVLMLQGEPFFFTYHLDQDIEEGLRQYDPRPDAFVTPSGFDAARYDRLLLGEKSPDYFLMKGSRLEYFLAVNPNARFIMLCRDPVQRLWSHVLHQFADYPDYVEHMATASTLEDSKLVNERVWRFVKSARRFGFYKRSLDAWRSLVPEDRLLVMPFREIENDPAAVVRCVLRFVGADPDGYEYLEVPGSKSVSASIAPPEFFVRWAAGIYADEIEFVDALSRRVE